MDPSCAEEIIHFPLLCPPAAARAENWERTAARMEGAGRQRARVAGIQRARAACLERTRAAGLYRARASAREGARRLPGTMAKQAQSARYRRRLAPAILMN